MNGYPTDTPCIVCGKIKDNVMEPRFNYVVCSDHYDVPPTEIGKNKQPPEKMIDQNKKC